MGNGSRDMAEDLAREEMDVLDQEISMEELNAVAGGHGAFIPRSESNCGSAKVEYVSNFSYTCMYSHKRHFTEPNSGRKPNCAATVESNSWCSENDACYDDAINYQGMDHCAKAWE